MDINYKLPNYFDGKNALTTPSVGVDNRGRSLVVGDTFSLSNSVINSFRVTAIRSINVRTPSVFKSPAEMGAKVYTTPLAGAFTNLGISNAFSMGGGGNNNAKYDYTSYQIADDFDMVRGLAPDHVRRGLPAPGDAASSTRSIRTASSPSTAPSPASRSPTS